MLIAAQFSTPDFGSGFLFERVVRQRGREIHEVGQSLSSATGAATLRTSAVVIQENAD